MADNRIHMNRVVIADFRPVAKRNTVQNFIAGSDFYAGCDDDTRSDFIIATENNVFSDNGRGMNVIRHGGDYIGDCAVRESIKPPSTA